VRRQAGNLFIEHGGKVELAAVAVLVAAFLVATGASNFDETLSAARRGQLYGSLAGTSGALLGFVLAALSILVALPSTERIEALRRHHSWPRVPSSYFRAARALLYALVLCTLGIALDSGKDPWVPYEVLVVAVLALALVRVTTAVVALDQILAVARQREPLQALVIDDPGP
jgi:hypothetical protein